MELPVRFVQVRERPLDAETPACAPYDHVSKLLAVRDDRLGDLVLTLPALDRLRSAYPDAELALLVAPPLVPLATMFRPVDRVLACGAGVVETAAAIRELGPDAAVCISRRAPAARALRRAGVRRVTGTGRRWFSPLFDRRVEGSRRHSKRHELEHAMDLASRAGATGGVASFPIDVPSDAITSVDAWLRQGRVGSPPIVIQPGSGGSCPAWPVASWLSLAMALNEARGSVVVNTGPGEQALAERFRDAGLPVFDGGLQKLAALLRRASIVLGNSSGPIHLASAFGRPVLAIHAPWRSCGAERWGPWGPSGWALVVGPAEPARWSRRRRRRWAAETLPSLDAGIVRRAAETMLDTGAPIPRET